MIKIKILKSLRDEIYKTFKKDSLKIYDLIKSLEVNPHKGDVLGHAGNISIRKLKHESFRFYFIIDGNEIQLFDKNKIIDLLIVFVRMSKKNNQQKTIDEIKAILKKLGHKGFEE
jgi:mRNA-degrading endonuclease RelE of RelBE toxin-antitoxin system